MARFRSARPFLLAPVLVALAAAMVALGAVAVLLSYGPAGTSFCGPVCLDSRLNGTVRLDGQLDPARLGLARTLVEGQLAYSPFETSAWLRLAALETVANGGHVGAAANRALEAAYRYAPVHIQTARWRIAFVFEHWTEVDAAVRNAAQREMRSLSVSDPNYRALRAIGPELRNPAGRLAFAFLVDDVSNGR